MADASGAPRGQWQLTGRAVLAMLLGFFAVVIVVNVVMARFAVSTFGGLETESSYKAGLAFSGEERAAERQSARGWTVDVEIGDLGPAGRAVLAQARDKDGKPLSGLAATGRFAHPTDARKDVALVLEPAGDGRYRGRAEAPAGQWDLLIDFTQGGERVFRSKNRVQLP